MFISRFFSLSRLFSFISTLFVIIIIAGRFSDVNEIFLSLCSIVNIYERRSIYFYCYLCGMNSFQLDSLTNIWSTQKQRIITEAKRNVILNTFGLVLHKNKSNFSKIFSGLNFCNVWAKIATFKCNLDSIHMHAEIVHQFFERSSCELFSFSSPYLPRKLMDRLKLRFFFSSPFVYTEIFAKPRLYFTMGGLFFLCNSTV